MRQYLLYAPPRTRGLKPLVLAYHGFGGNALQMAEESRLHEMVGEHGFYLVYPDGDPSWQLFVPEGAMHSRDVLFFDRLCEELIRTHPIDPDRIYVAGMSRGGDFAIYLAERRSTRIAAVVSQGACWENPVEAERPFPVMFIVGTSDDRVPPNRFPRVPQALRDKRHVVENLRPENVGHRWHVPLNDRVWQFLSSYRLNDDSPK